ncbi:hypothetical protein N7474_007213 [Penicillium riverlandense]|uniref:uncharacterized protein n=1 Tax=Penicillium riverlandense TaxID=1903569 RepID=UPI002549AC22|nr:uncharacterized protein N7474_007213 [Penicillium riverlandense]KAJ5815436.1 hypothetical protein N7474_007213 [Penicillium riverlandense]
MQNRVVLDALLALSGAQLWKGRDPAMKETILRLRQRALLGCQKLLTQSGLIVLMDTAKANQGLLGAMSANEIFVPLACCILLLLYEKLVGYGKANWMPHLKFLAQLFDRLLEPAHSGALNSLIQKCRQHQGFQFLHNLFLYNDLIQSTAGGTSTLSDYYRRVQRNMHSIDDDALIPTHNASLAPDQPQKRCTNGRFYYPYLIAEISTGMEILNDADIDAWDGRFDWLPSFSTTTIQLSDPTPSLHLLSKTELLLEPGAIDDKEERIMSYIYRDTAKVYLRQASRQRSGQYEATNHEISAATVACQAVRNIVQLREGSALENALLWPISIIARELTEECTIEREYILGRLQRLESRFHMEHFRRMQEVLMATWAQNNRLFINVEAGVEEDVFLFG